MTPPTSRSPRRPPDGAPPAGARRLRLLGTIAIGAVSMALLFWAAPPDQVVDRIASMNVPWLLVALALELASCLSYVVLFRRCFPEPPPRVSRRVAWIAMGVGAVLPGGNISSAAATGWLLRHHGIDGRALVQRCAALLCLLTALGFVVNGLAGVLLLAGVPDGPLDLQHAGIPILVSIGVLGTAAGVVAAARALGERAPRPLAAVAAGLDGAVAIVRRPHWRLLGAGGFLCLDMGALWAACAATGHRLGALAVIIAYCTGYLATMIPVPAGLGVLDSGLAGALVLYGLPPAVSVGAVLVYHAISIWIPGLGGVVAWLPVRRARARDRGVSGRAAGDVAGLALAAADPDG